MNILFIAKEFPHHRVIGGPIIIYNRIKHLSPRHTISLIAFGGSPSKEEIDSVSRFCKEVRIVSPPATGSTMRKITDYFYSPVPPYFLLCRSREMYQRLREMVRSFRYDLIISEFSMVSQYLYRNPDLDGIKRVMSVHECYYLARRKVFRVQSFNREGLMALYHLKGLKDFEFNMYASADKVLALTSEGREELLKVRPDLDISVVPHGVDVDHFAPPVERGKAHPPTLMFLGNFPHDPNRDAVMFFGTKVWPLIRERLPESRFLIVGRGPTKDMKELAAQDQSMIITGEVDDVRPYFHESDLFVCPVRMGGGFRGKVLEAMACGVPVVSTRLGAEGLPARSGENIILNDIPHEMADTIVRLLSEDSLREQIAARARELVVEKYSWEVGVRLLEEVLLGVLSHT